MRKYLSVILITCVLLSTVFTLPFSASADEIIEPSVRTITNTYDEDGAVYKSYKTVKDAETSETSVVEIADTDAFNNNSAYTVRTYNEKDVQLTAYDAVIKPYAEGNYSAFIGVHQNGISSSTAGWPNTLWIYDSTDANLGLFVPKANTSYKIKFNYRSDGTDYGKKIFLSLARKSSATGNSYKSEYAYIEKMVYISEQSAGWLTAEATFTTGSEVSELYLALHSDSNFWNTDVNLWVDNIEITEYNTGNATFIDFEEEQGEFYSVEDNLIGVIGQIDLSTADNHGNVMHLSKLKVYRNQANYGDNWNTVLGPTAFRIVDKLGNETLYFEAGELYNISFQMKKNSVIETTNFTQITAALVFDSSYKYQGGNVKTWVVNGNAVTIAETDLNADSDWVIYNATIKVPVSGYGAFMLYGSGNDTKAWVANCDIDVDNLSVSPAPQIKKTVVNFEDGQNTYQNENKVSQYGTIVDSETEQGYVYKATRLNSYRADYSAKPADSWLNNNNPGFIITEPNGIYPTEYDAGDVLSVSFKVKKNVTFDNANKFIHASMAFGLVADECIMANNIGSTVTLNNDGNIIELAKLDNTIDEDFVTYTATVVVPNDGNAAFMLWVDTWNENCDIYVDDVEINFIKETTVDFNDAQTSYITENPVGYNYEIISSEDDAHGNVMNFKRIVAQKNNWNGSIWNAGAPAAFSVLDEDGKGVLYYEKGEELTVSVQIKKPEEIISDDFDEFYAALTFVDDANKSVYEYIATLINQERVVKVATLDKSASDWVTYTTTLTVPHDGFAVFMVYAPEWFVDTTLLVDNLVIEEFDVSTLNRDGDLNGDGVVDVRDLVRIKKMAVGITDTAVIADIDFDGVVAGAGDLTKLRKFLLATDTAIPYTKDGRTLVWNEEFEYANAMNTNFSFTRSMNNSDDAEALGYTVEYDNASNHIVEDGELKLSVGKTDTGYSVCEGITTKEHMYFKYGYLEMRAKVPFSAGAWPSFWLLGNTPYHDENAEWFAEVDIFEVFSSTDTLAANIHKHGGQGQGYGEHLGVSNKEFARSYTFENSDNLSNEYHIYGFEWNETQMKFYVDGECFFIFNYSDYDEGKYYNGIEGFKEFMYIQLNSEVLTSVLTGVEEVNADYSIDYLRIYQNAANGEEIVY